jgi:hypothetical protein
MTQLQTEIYEELIGQGMDEKDAKFLPIILKNKEQQKAMMNYLVEIREQEVSKSQVIKMALILTGKM